MDKGKGKEVDLEEEMVDEMEEEEEREFVEDSDLSEGEDLEDYEGSEVSVRSAARVLPESRLPFRPSFPAPTLPSPHIFCSFSFPPFRVLESSAGWRDLSGQWLHVPPGVFERRLHFGSYAPELRSPFLKSIPFNYLVSATAIKRLHQALQNSSTKFMLTIQFDEADSDEESAQDFPSDLEVSDEESEPGSADGEVPAPKTNGKPAATKRKAPQPDARKGAKRRE